MLLLYAQGFNWLSEQLLLNLKEQASLRGKCFKVSLATFFFLPLFNISFLHLLLDILTMPAENNIMMRGVFLSLKVKENKPLFTAIQMDSNNLNPI